MSKPMPTYMLLSIAAWFVSLALVMIVRDWDWSLLYVAVLVQAAVSTLALISALLSTRD